MSGSSRNVSGRISTHPPTRCRCGTSTSMASCWCLRRGVSHGSPNVDAPGRPNTKINALFSLLTGKARREAEEMRNLGPLAAIVRRGEGGGVAVSLCSKVASTAVSVFVSAKRAIGGRRAGGIAELAPKLSEDGMYVHQCFLLSPAAEMRTRQRRGERKRHNGRRTRPTGNAAEIPGYC